MERSSFLVTGGAGFIGSNITEQLLSSGHTVRALDNFITGKKENLSFIDDLSSEAQSRFSLIEGDIRDLKTVTDALEGVDYILHQAALPSVIRSVEDPLLTNDININGTLTILEAARKNGTIKKLVYAASSSAYGDTEVLPKMETMPANPLSPYALQKYAGEIYMNIFSSIYGLKTVSLRYFNVFGGRQDPDSFYAAVVPKFITAFIKGEPPTIYGDGEQTRDFTYIDNVVQANIKAAFSSDKTNGKVFNVACGQRVSLNELLSMLNAAFDKNLSAIYTEPRAGDIKHSLADIGLAMEYFGYEPEVTFEDGIKRTISYLRQ